MAYFVVTSEQGPAWVGSRSMGEQELWDEHAAFINAALDAEFVVLGGPLGDGRPYRALLIVNSASASAVRARLAEDPWLRAGVLRILSVDAWKLLVSNEKLDPVLAEITKTDPPT
jgi:uncharacterized protein YciI